MLPRSVHYTNEALAFLLELVALGAQLWWGFHAVVGLPERLLLALGAPLVTVVVWGTFLSPRARYRLPLAVAVGAKLLILLLSAFAAYAVGAHAFALTFAVVTVLNLGLAVADSESMTFQRTGVRA